MQSVSLDPVEKTRKTAAQIQSAIMQRLSSVTQTHAASCMGTSPSTLSRFVSDDLEKFTLLLAAMGIKVADVDAILIDRDEDFALRLFAQRHLSSQLEQRRAA